MTLKSFVTAIADKLVELWPDRKVFAGQIPKGADGNFFVGIIESAQSRGLDVQRTRTVQFEVLYFLTNDSSMDFYEWAETMHANFQALEVPDGPGRQHVALTAQRARRDGEMMVYQYTFDARVNYLVQPDPGEVMETLQIVEELR